MILLLLGLATELLYLALYLIPDYHSRLFPFLGLFSIQFALYFVAVAFLLKRAPQEKFFIPILVLSVLFHLTLLPSHPIFEDDIYRYIWDGKMLLNGINPYQYPPGSQELLALRDTTIWPFINFKHISTIYPPFSQVLFAFAYWCVPDSVIAMKTLIVGFNFLLIYLISLLLKHLGMNRNMVLLYAWNPLVLKETANSGHMDPFAACLLFASILMLIRHRHLMAVFFYALAILSKLYPLLLLPFYFKRVGIKGVLFLFGVLALFYGPFFIGIDLHELFYGLKTYAKYWVFNPGLYFLTHSVFSLFAENPTMWTKVLHGVILSGIVVILAKRDDGGTRSLLHSSFFLFGTMIILSPVANTWYLLCIIPFLCIFPSLPWLLFSFLALAGYSFFFEHRDIPWIRWMEYAIFYIALITANFRSKGFPMASDYAKVFSKDFFRFFSKVITKKADNPE